MSSMSEALKSANRVLVVTGTRRTTPLASRSLYSTSIIGIVISVASSFEALLAMRSSASCTD
eukprot:6195300-Pleurochrysis_carterae.AAC.2